MGYFSVVHSYEKFYLKILSSYKWKKNFNIFFSVLRDFFIQNYNTTIKAYFIFTYFTPFCFLVKTRFTINKYIIVDKGNITRTRRTFEWTKDFFVFVNERIQDGGTWYKNYSTVARLKTKINIKLSISKLQYKGNFAVYTIGEKNIIGKNENIITINAILKVCICVFVCCSYYFQGREQ